MRDLPVIGMKTTGRREARVIDSRRLLAFWTLAQVGSFTETGRLLGLTQSAVSRDILWLEDDLGARLFRRLWRSSTLTKAGVALLLHAEVILGEMHRIRESMETAGGKAGRENGPAADPS
ncbi:LysR family transcriptional regulator [Opitutaceae bacterium TAV5]|nr:LysR family transcriptional regulator [Opitutaceae bacterium TAV5]